MTDSRKFDGTSSYGDIYEALDNAIAAAKDELMTDLVEWKMNRLSGVYGGFVCAKDLTITIEAKVPEITEGRQEQPNNADETDKSGGQVEVPVFLSGLVFKLTGVDFCMDGATHLLETFLGRVRLKAGNDEARKVLDEYSGTGRRVMIAGYRVWGPECEYIRVYHAAPVEDAVKRLGVQF